MMLSHGWLFPGRSRTDPISSRQLHRAVQEAADVAGIHKRVLAYLSRYTHRVIPFLSAPMPKASGNRGRSLTKYVQGKWLRVDRRC
ncbi:hypothetical protein [Rhizobium sp. AU243]|uniref:hypothetical protein n=1 Tax=Rhizobium sp. AU243 TaxID=2303425 RepID=UPI0025706EC8|nr:hypothetical protein [Rhizobium sp. AU243]